MRQTYPRPQMLLGIRCKLIAALCNRLTYTDPRHCVLQRLPGTDMHGYMPDCNNWDTIAIRYVFDNTSMKIVHGALMQT